MEDKTKIEKRRNILQIFAGAGLMSFVTGIIPFGLAKANNTQKQEMAKIQVKAHPFAVKRNNKG